MSSLKNNEVHRGTNLYSQDTGDRRCGTSIIILQQEITMINSWRIFIKCI